MVKSTLVSLFEISWDLATACDVIAWDIGHFFLVPIAAMTDWLDTFLQQLIPRYRFRRFREELHRLCISDDAWHPAVCRWNETVVDILLKDLRERKYV